MEVAEHASPCEDGCGVDGGRRYQMSKSAAEILANMDLFAEDQREHLLDALAIARRERPILPVGAEGGYHLVTRYEDVREVCEHPEVFSSVHPGLRIEPVRLIPL